LEPGINQYLVYPVNLLGEEGSEAAGVKVSIPLPPCDGDFDNDGDVDGTDLAIFSKQFGMTACKACSADFDGDGDVDGTDLRIFAADFGRTNCRMIKPLP
jgi:hypothetical protein